MLKQRILYPVRKFFTVGNNDKILSDLLLKTPDSRLLRGICPANSFYPDPTEREAERDGIRYKLNIHDYMDWMLYFNSKGDSSEDVLQYIKPGYNVIDIGGNIGQTALMIGKKLNNNGKVISFEPVPENYQKFLTNLRLNPSIKNVSVENCGLGNSYAKVRMSNPNKANSGQNRVANDNSGDGDLVEVITLDAYMAGKNIDVNFIKIDVEGFEFKVLQGAEQTLRKHKPQMFIEINEDNLKYQNDSSEALIKFLKGLGYTIIDLFDKKEWSESSKYRHTDIYCY
jgi:FkbM family methyltransferase